MFTKKMLLLISVASLALGCNDSPQAEYSTRNKTGFMAACTKTAADVEVDGESVVEIDNPLKTAICECAWSETETTYNFEDFVSLDNELLEDPSSQLPKKVDQIIANCVISEMEL